MSNEIKVGDWTLTPFAIRRLRDLNASSKISRIMQSNRASECCEILGIDPTTDSVSRDICEEIIFHCTPVNEAIEKLQRHLEATQ